MKDGLAIITITHNRAHLWPRLNAMMRRAIEHFSIHSEWRDRPIEWIIANDGDQEVEPVIMPRVHPSFIRLPNNDHQYSNAKEAAQQSFLNNMATALDLVTCNAVVFWEDDDWYSNGYLTAMVSALILNTGTRIVGETPSRYYHIPTRRYFVGEKMTRCSLCQTLIYGKETIQKALNIVRRSRKTDIDIQLWKAINESYAGILTSTAAPLCVGIKGLDPNGGVGGGHTFGRGFYTQDDESGDVLREWCGKDDAEEMFAIAGSLKDGK